MAYNFSINSGKLIVTLDTESGKFSENINEYLQPNLVLGNDRVFLKEDGLFKQDFVFEAFGDIGGNTAENLVDAYNLLNALIIGISVNSIENYIPLSGTTDGNPVTGTLELTNDVKILLNNVAGDIAAIQGRSDGVVELSSDAYNVLISANGGLSVSNGIETNSIKGNDGIYCELLIAGSASGKGLVGVSDYSANITDLDYPQKIYVDGLRGKHISKTTTEINSIATPEAGETYFNTTLSTLCFYNGTAWKRVIHLPM